MVLRRCFRGGGCLRVVDAARDSREEAVGDRGVLPQQFRGVGSGGEGQEAASREEGSTEGEIVSDRATQSEKHAERLTSDLPSLLFFSIKFGDIRVASQRKCPRSDTTSLDFFARCISAR